MSISGDSHHSHQDVDDVDNDVEPIERVIEQDREHDVDSEHSEAEEAEERAPSKPVDPTKVKRIVKNPRLTLNPKRLTGPRGIQTIEEIFKDFKFQGQGHEKEDLDIVLKKLEYWAHRLYPKFKFDDCLEKIESLGKKREVANHIRKIRLNMLCDENDEVIDKSDAEDAPNTNHEEGGFDEFDKLLNQQIALARSTPAIKHNETNSIFPPAEDNPPSTNVEPAIASPSTTRPSLSDEQRERMLQNRRLAEQKRLERLRLLEESKKATNNENSMEIEATNGDEIMS